LSLLVVVEEEGVLVVAVAQVDLELMYQVTH
jgi:hypothetical protein